MPKSIQESIIQPTYTKAVIKAALRSKLGLKTVWCIVEGQDDIKIYGKFFDTKTTKVLPSKNEKGKMGYNNVEIIVNELLHEESLCLIFGIRDRDYTRYNKNYTCPQNIFLTDHRDIEMMMFNAPSVINSLKVWNPKFPEKINDCVIVCRYLGYLRIYNDVFNIGCTFHDNIKVSDVWSMKAHTLIKDWYNLLLSKFLSNCNGAVNKEDINTFIATNKLDDESFLNICRGHDVINLLQYMMVKKEYSKNNIVVCMINSYSFEDFEKTNLCQKINNWSIGKGVNVLFCKDG